jgi:hypothetical protein
MLRMARVCQLANEFLLRKSAYVSHRTDSFEDSI